MDDLQPELMQHDDPNNCDPTPSANPPLYEVHRDLLEFARSARDLAGRGEVGRRLAIYVTDLEKGLAWIDALARDCEMEEEMTFGRVGVLSGRSL